MEGWEDEPSLAGREAQAGWGMGGWDGTHRDRGDIAGRRTGWKEMRAQRPT